MYCIEKCVGVNNWIEFHLIDLSSHTDIKYWLLTLQHDWPMVLRLQSFTLRMKSSKQYAHNWNIDTFRRNYTPTTMLLSTAIHCGWQGQGRGSTYHQQFTLSFVIFLCFPMPMLLACHKKVIIMRERALCFNIYDHWIMILVKAVLISVNYILVRLTLWLTRSTGPHLWADKSVRNFHFVGIKQLRRSESEM